jgi:peroxiredoxin
VSSWRELGKIAGEFRALDVAIFGVSADTSVRLQSFREDLDLPFTMLSDPMLTTAVALDVPVATKANFVAVSVLHPTVRTYPRRSFMQPALFVWRRDGILAHSWCQTESRLTNLYGARGRPRSDQVLQVVRDVLAEP